MGWDCHRKFSTVAARDAENRIVWRQRLDHGDRDAMGKRLRTWPAGTPVVLEGTFGWGWITDELQAAPHRTRSWSASAEGEEGPW
jgi:hypothetical protein